MGDLMTSGFDASEVRIFTAESLREWQAANPADAVVPQVPVFPAAAGLGLSIAGPLGEPGGALPFSAESAGAGGFATAIGMFDFPAEWALHLGDAMRAGEVLVAVRAGARGAIAKTILERNGGRNAMLEGTAS